MADENAQSGNTTRNSAPEGRKPSDLTDEEWMDLVRGWMGELDDLREDLERLASMKTASRSRRGDMMRSAIHSTLRSINEAVRMRTKTPTASQVS